MSKAEATVHSRIKGCLPEVHGIPAPGGLTVGQWLELHLLGDAMVGGDLVHLFSPEQDSCDACAGVPQNLDVSHSSLLPLLGV